jgi:Family of unknown function (DUF6338)
MGEVGFETIAVLLILLPGFMCAGIVQGLCVRRDQSDFDKIVQALIYSFAIYVIYSIIPVLPPIGLSVKTIGEAKYYSVETRPASLFLLAITTLILALLIAGLENNGLLFQPLRWLRITQRTGRSSIWNDVFNSLSGYVQVELQDGRNVLGWLKLYSDKSDEASLFLEDASWIDEEKNVIRIDGPGIYLTKESGVRTIMFLHPVEKPGEGS